MKTRYCLLLLIVCGFSNILASPIKLCHDKKTCISIEPATLHIILKPSNIPLSETQSEKPYHIQRQSSDHLNFSRNHINIAIQVKQHSYHIRFNPIGSFSTTENRAILFPIIKKSDAFLLPMLEGRYIPTHDSQWIRYLTSTTGPQPQDQLQGTSNLSMQFLTAIYKNSAVYYEIENIFNNHFWFSGQQKLGLSFSHTFNALNKQAAFGFTIKILPNKLNVIANTYRQHKLKQGKFITLAQKAKIVPDVTKLYGAPFIYLWGDEVIGNSHIRWKKLQTLIKQQFNDTHNNPTRHFAQLLQKNKTYCNTLATFAKSQYLYPSLKSNMDHVFKILISNTHLWNIQVFQSSMLNSAAKAAIKKGIHTLSPIEQLAFHKNLIQSAYHQAIDPTDQWGNGVSLWMLKQLQQIGLKKAWLGLNDRQDGILHHRVVKQAVKQGYLMAPYDSYQSIHKANTADNSWSTALFQDRTLYEHGSIIQQDGQFVTGFLGRGRTLNTAFAFPEVKYRLYNTIVHYQTPFNSWFFDTDGAGTLYDDFSLSHPMTQSQDADHRLQRMNWTAKHYHIVIGTEDGKDYSAPIAAFGHGLVNQGIWDPDMRRHKQSKYYIGNYWSPDGGVPPRFGKPTPLKPHLAYIYFNPRFEVPLYQLVYNNSIITSDHWEYGTFKFPSQIKNNLLKTFLYNYPPLLHLDRKTWETLKPLLKHYLPIWSKWHHQLVQTQMTNFVYLSQDKQLQSTQFANGIRVIANFSQYQKNYHQWKIPPKHVFIVKNNTLLQQFDANFDTKKTR